MRFLLVFILLLLNASYFAWQFYEAQSPVRRWPATDPGIPELQLAKMSRPTTVPTSAPRHTVAQSPKRSEVRPGTASASKEKKEADSEPEPASAQAPQPTQVAPHAAAKDAPSAAACGWLGPYSARNTAEAAVQRLAAARPGSRVVQSEHTEDRYWVLLPPLASHGAAMKVIGDLKAHGMTDIQLLGGEGRANAISLGVFAQRATAERRLKQISALGYNPEMQNLPQTVARYWAVYPTPKPLPDDLRRALLSSGSGLRIERRACP